jgi:hypothetical protein
LVAAREPIAGTIVQPLPGTSFTSRALGSLVTGRSVLLRARGRAVIVAAFEQVGGRDGVWWLDGADWTIGLALAARRLPAGDRRSRRASDRRSAVSPCRAPSQRVSVCAEPCRLLSQGGSAGSNPVGATREVAGQGPDRRSRRSGLDHLSSIRHRARPSPTGSGRYKVIVIGSVVRLT